MTFRMPNAFANSDLIFTDLLADDVGRAQAAWAGQWEAASSATGWTIWLIYGRLAAARAEIALRAESPESALEWAQQAVEIARRTRRRKYEARSLSLGEAQAKVGRRDEALRALRGAVKLADELVGPPARWDARAALGRVGVLARRRRPRWSAYGEAGRLVDAFAADLAPERAAQLARAPVIEEIRAAGR